MTENTGFLLGLKEIIRSNLNAIKQAIETLPGITTVDVKNCTESDVDLHLIPSNKNFEYEVTFDQPKVFETSSQTCRKHILA